MKYAWLAPTLPAPEADHCYLTSWLAKPLADAPALHALLVVQGSGKGNVSYGAVQPGHWP